MTDRPTEYVLLVKAESKKILHKVEIDVLCLKIVLNWLNMFAAAQFN